MEPGETADEFIVKGRGMLHLGILVENMRREGFEFQIGPPKVIMKKGENGKKLEPFDEATVDVPEEHVGPCVDLLGSRKGVMQDMVTTNVCFLFSVPREQCFSSPHNYAPSYCRFGSNS